MNTTGKQKELFELIRERSFQYGDFTLSSGKKSPYYFNLKPCMMQAKGALLCAHLSLDVINALSSRPSLIGGLEMGAIPVISAIAALSEVQGCPVDGIFVRKEIKAHGSKARIEGLMPDESLKGRSVLVMDDVATSGASILKAAQVIRDAGGVVQDALCLVNRHEGADALMEKARIKLHSIFDAEDFAPGRA